MCLLLSDGLGQFQPDDVDASWGYDEWRSGWHDARDDGSGGNDERESALLI